jgi:S-formylglutathione hydrolase FrmB
VCGGEDGSAEETHAFLAALAKRHIPYEYRELSPRGHDWRILNEEILVFLDTLEKLDGFEPLREEAVERHNR